MAHGRLGIGVAAAAAVVAGAANTAPLLSVNSRFRQRYLPELAGTGPSHQVALTFDDGPDPTSTPRFIDRLDRLGWKATFFLLGDMVRPNRGLVAELVAAGHEVALHGDQHRSHVLRTPWAVTADLARSKDEIESASGLKLRWFRPPYGSMSLGSVMAARRLGVTAVLWGAWGRDWTADATPRSVMDELNKELVGGCTILLHDSDCTSAPGAWRSALGALDLLAEELDRRDLLVTTLGRHLGTFEGTD